MNPLTEPTTEAGWPRRRCPHEYITMIGFLHFAILDDELYFLGPSMPDWLNGLYFLSLAEIQEVRLHDFRPSAVSDRPADTSAIRTPSS